MIRTGLITNRWRQNEMATRVANALKLKRVHRAKHIESLSGKSFICHLHPR